jgi:P2-related tail formation protein
MSLLPHNSTKFERDVEQSIKYGADVSFLFGFKFENADPQLRLALAWEYSLAQIQSAYDAAGSDSINGSRLSLVEFHRLRGTPAALRNALSWYEFENVIFEEEIPGEHFAEFQIGLDEIPNNLAIDKLIEVAKFAAPLRSRLTRMYNAEYDIRRFVLDESDWGDILSDNSGTRLSEDSPMLSFGRKNAHDLQRPEITTKFSNFRHHFSFAINSDTYKLDEVYPFTMRSWTF